MARRQIIPRENELVTEIDVETCENCGGLLIDTNERSTGSNRTSWAHILAISPGARSLRDEDMQLARHCPGALKGEPE